MKENLSVLDFPGCNCSLVISLRFDVLIQDSGDVGFAIAWNSVFHFSSYCPNCHLFLAPSPRPTKVRHSTMLVPAVWTQPVVIAAGREIKRTQREEEKEEEEDEEEEEEVMMEDDGGGFWRCAG